MSSIAISLAVFACVFGGALVGMSLQSILPQEHLGTDSRDVIRLATGLVVTMSALVLGMLVSSAKGAYDTQKADMMQMAAKVVLLDNMLAHYGPETQGCRNQLRRQVEQAVDEIWPAQPGTHSKFKPMVDGDKLYDEVEHLHPENEEQGSFKAQALNMATQIKQTRLVLYIESGGNSLSIPLLIVVISWITAVFISFGMFSPPNSTVILTLVVCALAVSAAIFIIQEMYSPFTGLLRISSAPIRDALDQIGR